MCDAVNCYNVRLGEGGELGDDATSLAGPTAACAIATVRKSCLFAAVRCSRSDPVTEARAWVQQAREDLRRLMGQERELRVGVLPMIAAALDGGGVAKGGSGGSSGGSGGAGSGTSGATALSTPAPAPALASGAAAGRMRFGGGWALTS